MSLRRIEEETDVTECLKPENNEAVTRTHLSLHGRGFKELSLSCRSYDLIQSQILDEQNREFLQREESRQLSRLKTARFETDLIRQNLL